MSKEIQITDVTPYQMHNNAFDDANVEYETKMAEWRYEVAKLVEEAKSSDEDFDPASAPPEPKRSDVPPTVPALRVSFSEGDNDNRGLYVCVHALATQDEIKAAISACLADAPKVESESLTAVAAGDVIKL